jgi:hypothetical protein
MSRYLVPVHFKSTLSLLTIEYLVIIRSYTRTKVLAKRCLQTPVFKTGLRAIVAGR